MLLPSYASEAAAFFAQLAHDSGTLATFHQPGKLELGPYHPENTFRTPFALDRTKTSWYFRSPFKVEGAAATTDMADRITLTYVLNSDSIQNASAILDTKLYISDSHIQERFISARVELVHADGRVQLLQSIPSRDHLDLARRILGSHQTPPSSTDVLSIPWFYTLSENRFFSGAWLAKSGAALRHVFVIAHQEDAVPREATDFARAEFWVTAAWASSDEETRNEAFQTADLFVPDLTRIAQSWGDDLTRRIAQSRADGGDGTDNVCAALGPESLVDHGFAFAFAWRLHLAGPRATEPRVTLMCGSPSGAKYLLKDYPQAFLGASESSDWRVWHTAAALDSPWPPPGVGVDSRVAPCPGTEHFTLYVNGVNKSRARLEFAVARMRILSLAANGSTDFR